MKIFCSAWNVIMVGRRSRYFIHNGIIDEIQNVVTERLIFVLYDLIFDLLGIQSTFYPNQHMAVQSSTTLSLNTAIETFSHSQNPWLHNQL